MVLTRAQAAAMKAQLVSTNDPEALARQIRAQALILKQADAATSAQLDELADMFSSSVSVGKTPQDALVESLSKLGIGGRRRKTRKTKKRKTLKRTRKH